MASIVRHPKSEAQKRIALDTEQDPTPAATSIDQGTGTSDVARAGSLEHDGDGVAMGRGSADDDSARHPNPSGSDSRRITVKRKPREVRVEQSSTTEQHVPRMLLGKTTLQRHSVAVTMQEALDGSSEKTMRTASVENNTLNWVSISSGEALDMTHCDFSERRARDEMRHIIGSSEPDVIIGSDKGRNRGCRKKNKNHIISVRAA